MRESRDDAKRLQSTQEPHPRERQVRNRAAQVVATVAAATILWLIVRHQVAGLRSDERRPEEFMAFYTVGRMLNDSSSQLYEPAAFLKKYVRLFGSGGAPLYAHAPFEGLIFQPFARLPFKSALVAWQAVSAALICAGFTLVWLSGESLPPACCPSRSSWRFRFSPCLSRSYSMGRCRHCCFSGSPWRSGVNGKGGSMDPEWRCPCACRSPPF